MPPVTIFDYRHRPKGLEFSCCDECHDATRLDDQVLGLLSRIYPGDGQVVDDDLRRVFQGMRNNLPALLEEMRPTAEHERRLAATRPGMGFPLRADGPLVTRTMLRIAGRMGLAFHFNETGRIVPTSGGVASRWLTNFQLETKGFPEGLLQIIGPPRSLRQGSRFDTGDQFSYGCVVAQERTISAHLATFRQSFALIAYAAEDAALLATITGSFDAIRRPGFLKEDKASMLHSERRV